MTYYIPNPDDKKLIQNNRDDFSGNIFSTKNINFENGYIKLSSGVAIITREIDDDDPLEDFNFLTAMTIGDGDLVVKGNDKYFSTSELTYRPLQEIWDDTTNPPDPGIRDDLIYFNGQWLATEVSGSTVTITRLDPSDDTWKTVTTSSATDAQTLFSLFSAHNGLIISSANGAILVAPDFTIINTLVLPFEHHMIASGTVGAVSYIGTHNIDEEEARLFIWEGNSAAAATSYGVQSYEISAIVNHESSVVLVTADGRLLEFNGGGFKQIARWPVFKTPYAWGRVRLNETVLGGGIVSDGETIFINIRGELFLKQGVDYLTNQPGGIWSFNSENGLYHRHAASATTISFERIDTLSNVDLSENTITLDDLTSPLTGTPCRYDLNSTSGDTLLVDNDWYYVIKVDSTKIKIATSRKKAFAGEALDLISQGKTTQYLIFYEEQDYGQLKADKGALVRVGGGLRDGLYVDELVFTTTEINHTDGDIEALCVVAPQLYNRGYFVTPRIYSNNKSDTYQPIAIKHSYLGDDDEIIIKAKTKETRGLPTSSMRVNNKREIRGTWKSTTTISVDATSVSQDISLVETGDEIEIIDGLGSGQLFHIAGISETTGIYTFTLDEGCYFAEIDKVITLVFDRWQKIGVLNSENQDEKTDFRIDVEGSFIQTKIELRGNNTTIYEVQIGNKTFQPLV